MADDNDTGLSDSLINAVKGFEGFNSNAYPDGRQTSIGYGTKAKDKDERIDRDEAHRRLVDELSQSQRLVDGFSSNMPAGVRDALTSLTYNAGPKWMQSGLGEAVKNGDWDTAKQHFLQYNKAGGMPNQGLANRRAAEAQWFPGGNPSPLTQALANSDQGVVAGADGAMGAGGLWNLLRGNSASASPAPPVAPPPGPPPSAGPPGPPMQAALAGALGLPPIPQPQMQAGLAGSLGLPPLPMPPQSPSQPPAWAAPNQAGLGGQGLPMPSAPPQAAPQVPPVVPASAALPPNAQPTSGPVPVGMLDKLKKYFNNDRIGNIGDALEGVGIHLQSINNPAALSGLSAINQARALRTPQWGVIGEDMFGGKTYGFINPNTGKVVPYSGAPGSGGDADYKALEQRIVAKRAAGASQQEILNEFPAEIREDVKAMVEGRAIPQNLSRQGEMRNKLLWAAHLADPNFTEQQLQAQTKFRNDFSLESPNFIGGRAQALQRAIAHLGDTSDTAVALGNSNGMGIAPLAEFWNGVRNWGSNSQKALADRLAQQAQIQAGEAMKFNSGNTGGGVHEREAIKNFYGSSKSPENLASALEANLGLLLDAKRVQEGHRDETFPLGNGPHLYRDEALQKDIDHVMSNIDKLRGRTPEAKDDKRPSLTSIFGK